MREYSARGGVAEPTLAAQNPEFFESYAQISKGLQMSGSRSRLRVQRDREQFLFFCGTKDPDHYHVQRAARFISEMKSPWSGSLTPKNPGKIRLAKKDGLPSRALAGAGMLWLRLFADYEGDKCLLFPFRTASTPRGVVAFNFKAMPAHRAMCLHVHKLPKDDTKTMVLHSCGNGHLGCVNPRHLYWGDQSDNNADARRHAVDGKQAA